MHATAADRSGWHLSRSSQLGHRLRSLRGRVPAGLCLVPAEKSRKGATWPLQRAGEGSPGAAGTPYYAPRRDDATM